MPLSLAPSGRSVVRLLALLLIASCQRAVASQQRNTAETAVELVRLFAEGRLSAAAAKKSLGAMASIERSGAYWQLRSGAPPLEVIVRGGTMDEATDDAEVRFDPGSGLRLSALEKAFGRWEPVFASKTSSVVFRTAAPTRKPVLVFAQLSTHTPVPDSPVSSVRLRPDATASPDRGRLRPPMLRESPGP